MSTGQHHFGFSCTVDAKYGKLKYGPYRITSDGKEKELRATPPKMFKNVIFDILQEYIFYGGRLNIKHTISYVHIDLPEEADLVCVDVANLQTEHKIDASRAIIPCRYDLVPPTEIEEVSVCFGDIYYALIRADWTNNHKINFEARTGAVDHWCKQAGIVDLDFSVTRENDEFRFSGTFTIRRHLLGEFAGAALIPIFPDKNVLPKHAVVSGSWTRSEENADLVRFSISEKAHTNLQQLSRQLEYRASQTTWVFGEPGSGKEVFARALHAGSVRSRGKELAVRSAAGANLEEINKRLFSSIVNEKCLIEEVDGGGTIFLDEFDKVDEGEMEKIFSSMLRVLEADEYIRTRVDWSGRSSDSAAKYEDVNWIFAGSFSTSSVEKVPGDFWSRLTGKINLRNPIKEDSSYAATLFMFFYFSETIKSYGQRSGLYLDGFVNILEKQHDERLFNEQVVADILGYGKISLSLDVPVTPCALLIDFAESFASEVIISRRAKDGSATKVDSSRSIRQAARAAFFVMRQAAIESEDKLFDFVQAMTPALDAAKSMLKTSRGDLERSH